MTSFLLFFFTFAEAEEGRGNLRKAEEIEQTTRRQLKSITSYGPNPMSRYPLDRCEGDCDNDSHCEADLICFQRDGNELVPGCSGGQGDSSRTDYCIDPSDLPPGEEQPAPSPVAPPQPTPASGGNNPQLQSYGGSPPGSKFPLQECEGDCDSDSDCGPGLR